VSWPILKSTTAQLSATALDHLDPDAVTSHIVNLTGLAPNTTYHFRVKSKDAAKNLTTSSDQTFTTLANPRSLSLSGLAYAEARTPRGQRRRRLDVETWFKDTSSYGYFHLNGHHAKGDLVSDRKCRLKFGIAFDQLFMTEKSNNPSRTCTTTWNKHHVTPIAGTILRSASRVNPPGNRVPRWVQVLQGTLSS